MSNKIVFENGYWIVYQAGTPMARSRKLSVLQKNWPDVPVQGDVDV